MGYLILAFVVLFSLLFLWWGIYQIKTGTMVAKRARKPVDEPRQVGALFVVLGLVGLCFLPSICGALFNLPALVDAAAITWPLVTFVASGFLICAGLYGVVTKRIFGIKTTAKTKKYIARKYPVVSILMFIMAAGILLAFFAPQAIIPSIALLIVAIACLILAGILLKISSLNQK